MAQVGLKAEIIPSMAREEAGGLSPREAVEKLARQKAEAVAKGLEGSFAVIGADTVVSVDGRILGKPGSREEAAEMLGRIQGRAHQVYTGVTVILTGKEDKQVTFSEQTDVFVYPMSKREIAGYVESGEPMDKAGAYGIQGAFAAYIREIRGDYYNVVGLPIGRLYQELKALEVI